MRKRYKAAPASSPPRAYQLSHAKIVMLTDKTPSLNAEIPTTPKMKKNWPRKRFALIFSGA